MSFLEKMDTAIESPQTALHMLLMKMSNISQTLHIYYEGKCDNKLYFGMIRKLVKNQINIRTIVCGSKKNVFKFRGELSEISNENNKLLFFVDKDIDDFFERKFYLSREVHESLFYSIENYVACEQVLISICRECFDMSGLENSSAEFYQELVQSYHQSEQLFFSVIKDLMIFAFIARLKVHKPTLGNMCFSDIFHFDEDCKIHFHMKGGYENLLEYFIDKTKCDISPFLDTYQEVEEKLNNLDVRSFIRGKYHFGMFCGFLSALQKALKDKLPYKQRFQINDENIFLFAGPRIKVPASIINFLNINIPNYLNNDNLSY
ncbi:DUF4435 domain-containing protein [Pantoea ananatis]|uniref:DUF4435 domain-containing protein n=1 Tax=Pantoea ananas TaxID=553 RepID=UPI000B7DDF02|nr:DUF4435 domain-containing protein [Pantoea ananatis]